VDKSVFSLHAPCRARQNPFSARKQHHQNIDDMNSLALALPVLTLALLTGCAQTPTGTRAKPHSTGTLHFGASYETVIFNLQNVAAACIRDDNRSRHELSFEEREAGKIATLTTKMTSLYGTQILSILDITRQDAGTDIRYFQGDFSWHNRDFIEQWVNGEMHGCKAPVAPTATPMAAGADALAPVNLIVNPGLPVDPGTSAETGAIAKRVIESGVFSKVALQEAKYPISVVMHYHEESPPATASESAQSWAGALTIGVVPMPLRKIFVLDVALVFDGAVERQLSYQEEVTLQQGMLTGDVAKQQHAIADRLVRRFLDEVKREHLLP
jgi:hypothetical protein